MLVLINQVNEQPVCQDWPEERTHKFGGGAWGMDFALLVKIS